MLTKVEMEKIYRPEINNIPKKIASLPVERGYPIPWFVAQIDGKYDFRVADGNKMTLAIKQSLCWICGQKMKNIATFTMGPMSVFNQVTSEPPSHYDCAKFAIKHCPFINGTTKGYNNHNMPEGVSYPVGAIRDKQPKVMCLWSITKYRIVQYEEGILFHFDIQAPESVSWYTEGRLASLKETLDSVYDGVDILQERIENNEDNLSEDNKLKEEQSLLRNLARTELLIRKTVRPNFASNSFR